jgi:hypothetical protein
MMPEMKSLGATNARLAELLATLDNATESVPALAKAITALSPVLYAAAAVVHGEPQTTENLAEYQQVLLQLRDALPRVHARLVLESDRMKNQRTHRQAAAAWIAASRITF